MIVECLTTGKERQLSDSAVTIDGGMFGQYVNHYCYGCEKHHVGLVKGSDEYRRN